MKRIDFVKSAVTGAILTPSLVTSLFQGEQPPLDKGLVEEFVRIAHSDKDKVVAMLTEHPTLLNAAHDWGGGDFETGLGAASHVGNIDTAKLFIESGAQTNIFTACLFGHMNIVKPILEAFPDTLHAKGPHGLTLLHHANNGGDAAADVKSYLESLGAIETRIPLY